MFCKHCGAKNEDLSKFCTKCGTSVSEQKSNTTYVQGYPVTQTPIAPESIIKCGNCDYIGPGEPARSTGAKILAWICVVFAPMITIIYFLATSKYKCPKCKSTFLGIKNKEGVFVGQKGSKAGRAVLIFLCILFGIAIIGILASVVLASLNTARSKGQDAAIKANLANMRAGAELYWDTLSTDGKNGSYAGLCNSETVTQAINSITKIKDVSVTCNDNFDSYAISAPLNSGDYFCVDSSGRAETISTELSNETACNEINSTSTKSMTLEEMNAKYGKPTSATTLSGAQLCAKEIPNSTWDGESYLDSGAYECSCKSGYEINKAGNACATPNQNCNEQYPNSVDIGNNTCDCKPGYSWNPAETACYR